MISSPNSPTGHLAPLRRRRVPESQDTLPPFLVAGGTVDPRPRGIQGGGSSGTARSPSSRGPLQPCPAALRRAGWGARRPGARLHARARVAVSCVASCCGQAETRGAYEPRAESFVETRSSLPAAAGLRSEPAALFGTSESGRGGGFIAVLPVPSALTASAGTTWFPEPREEAAVPDHRSWGCPRALGS